MAVAVRNPRTGERRSQGWSPRTWKATETGETRLVFAVRVGENSTKPKDPLKPSTKKVMEKCFKCGEMVPDYGHC